MKSFRIGKVHARSILVFAALLVLILRIASAQAPGSQTAPPTTTIKVSTRLVAVDVVALDKKGQPIEGLTKGDFELWDDRQPEEISVFSAEGSQVSLAQGAAPLATLPPNGFTNRPARPSDVPITATVILFDVLNTGVLDVARARDQVAKFIRQMEPQDRVALYTLGGNLRVMQDFTSDSALLLKALQGVHSQLDGARMATPPSPVPSAQVPGVPDRTQSIRDPAAYFQAYQKVDMTLRVFEAIGEHLADVPGRKTLIWISHGIPLTIKTATPDPHVAPDETEFTLQIQRISRLLSKYNVAVYPIDPRRGVNLPCCSPQLGSSFLLAQWTGGRAFYKDDALDLAMRTAIDDAKLTYVLGYYPAAEKWDSKFHTLKVRVNRPGVKLLYRSGYLAVAQQNQTPDDQQRMMNSALLSPLDSTAIGLRAKLQKEAAGGSQQLTLNLRVDINDLMLTPDHNRRQGELEIVIAQLSPTGEVLSESARKHSTKLNLKEDYYTQLKAEGLSLSFPFPSIPQAVQLKVVVRDTSSGAMGSVGIPLNKTAGE